MVRIAAAVGAIGSKTVVKHSNRAVGRRVSKSRTVSKTVGQNSRTEWLEQQSEQNSRLR